MSLTAYSIFLLDVALEICLLWRLSQQQLWRRYAYLFGYIVYVLAVMDLGLFGVLVWVPRLYRPLYWGCETAGVTLRFLVVWEVIRHTFPRGSMLRGILCKGVAAIGFLLGVILLCGLWSFAAYGWFHSPFAAIERGFGLAQAVLILGVLAMARYYGVPLGRNLWGIVVGFGAYVSLSTVNFALIDLDHSFLRYWQMLVPLSFNGMLAVWTWAVWTYAPNPPVAMIDETEGAEEIRWWAQHWERALSAVRRVVHP